MHRAHRRKPTTEQLWWDSQLLRRQRRPRVVGLSWVRPLLCGLVIGTPLALLTYVLVSPEQTQTVPPHAASTASDLSHDLSHETERNGIRPTVIPSEPAPSMPSTAAQSIPTASTPTTHSGSTGTEPRTTHKMTRPAGKHRRARPTAPARMPPVKICIRERGSHHHSAPVCYTVTPAAQSTRQ